MSGPQAIKCVGIKQVETTFTDSTPAEAYRRFVAEHGIAPSEINGSSVIGLCARCSVLLLDGDFFCADESDEGSRLFLCEKCHIRVTKKEAIATEHEPELM